MSKQILIDAIDPREYISLKKARYIVRLLVAGLVKYDAEEGATVCIHLFNHVS